MADSTDKLAGMGLTGQNNVTDETIKWHNWNRRVELQRRLKETDNDLNDLGSLWRTTNTCPTNVQVGCNAPVHIAKVSPVVTLGSEDGTSDRILPERLYICKEETAAWIKEYLNYTTFSNSNMADLQSTMPNTNYSITKYGDYVPKVVRNAADKYKTKYFEFHTGDHPKLTKEMIDISFVTFQCHLNLGE